MFGNKNKLKGNFRDFVVRAVFIRVIFLFKISPTNSIGKLRESRVTLNNILLYPIIKVGQGFVLERTMPKIIQKNISSEMEMMLV